MFIQSWSQVFLLSLQGVWYGFVQTFPKVLGAIIIFVIGWIVAGTLGRLVMMAIDALKLDKLFKGSGVEEALARGGWKLHIGGFIGWLVKWMVILAFFVWSVNILGLDQVSMFLQQVLAYIPQIIIAVLILVAGTVFADFARRVISGGAAVANVRSSKMIGSIAYYAIWVLSVVMALDKLGVFGVFGQIFFTGLVLMCAIAFGLAFGLGGKEAASRWINRVTGDLSSRD